MEKFITILVFFAVIINICTLGAYLIGIKLQVNDPNCEDEVKSVKQNKLAIKLIQLFNVFVSIAMLIFLVFE